MIHFINEIWVGVIFVTELMPNVGVVVFETLDILRTELHTSELLWEMLGVSRHVELRFVRRWYLLVCNSLPVDAFEPRVLLNV